MPPLVIDMEKRYYQTLMIGLSGAELTREEENLLSRFSPGGVILFRRNIAAPEQVAALCSRVHDLCRWPPLIAIDQEGGVVDRLRDLLSTTIFPHELTAKEDPGKMISYGEIVGQLLVSLGIDLNLAPVVDLDFSSADNALQDRYWGSDASAVSEAAGAFLKGLNAGGVKGCLKHFPGLGRANVDSHRALPIVQATLNELMDNDLVPFFNLAKDVPVVMTAHCRFVDVDGEKGPPASASPAVYRLLRQQIGFAGIAMTDDLEMGALDLYPSFADRMAAALNAGADMIPVCNDPRLISGCFPLLEKIVKSQLVPEDRMNEASDRILKVKDLFPGSLKPNKETPTVFSRLDQRLLRLHEELKADVEKT